MLFPVGGLRLAIVWESNSFLRKKRPNSQTKIAASPSSVAVFCEEDIEACPLMSVSFSNFCDTSCKLLDLPVALHIPIETQ